MQNKIIKKPWGSEELIELNSKYCLKKLFMKKGHRCSLQYHEKKIETIFVLEGILHIETDKDKIILNQGESITLSPGDVHRMSAIDIDALYLEASTPELDDVIRIEDDYGR
jgi:mannose-6-phosphate isomerase-like protein (cupin superfamily)